MQNLSEKFAFCAELWFFKNRRNFIHFWPYLSLSWLYKLKFGKIRRNSSSCIEWYQNLCFFS